MNPPDHIKGRMSRYTPAHIMQERNKWCADMASAGESLHDVAKCLGITYSSALAASKDGGYVPRGGKSVSLYHSGVRYGPPSSMNDHMEDDVQWLLFDLCVTTGLSICDVVAIVATGALTRTPRDELTKLVKAASKQPKNKRVWRH